ncbi:MAG TPA: tRNA pseudouridine(55) synthase TruB [Steroidobacteraceae bacterium]|nr:tRNA pseudouridine(55) synthase TruB [Steroidobacteraceae bacterium]
MRSGILLLDKPRGLSSNAALQRVRRLLGGIKAGHAGSLDPLATGMLPICLGEATKIAADIVSARKRYRCTIALGVRTTTGDAEGEVAATAAVPALERRQVETALAGLLGRSAQVPPMYSALKRGGEPLYRLARAGVEVERAPRTIELYELALLALADRRLEFEAYCSKGTYIRVLAEDIAARLGTCGHVAQLRRLYVEPFEHEPMVTLEALASRAVAADWPALLAVDYPLRHLPAVTLRAADAVRLLRGQAIAGAKPPGAPQSAAGAAVRVRLYDEAGTFLGIGAEDGSGAVRPRRLLNRETPVATQ